MFEIVNKIHEPRIQRPEYTIEHVLMVNKFKNMNTLQNDQKSKVKFID